MASAADIDGHWVISVEDRAKHNAQFEQLKPVNGFVSGDQVRPLLMKSGLPLPVLGHVWNLADINGDGKMNQLEFSVAIHLIRKRLQGVPLPKTLPASLKAEPVTTPSPPPSRPVVQAPSVTSPVTAVSSPPTVTSAATSAATVPVPHGSTLPSTTLPPNSTTAPMMSAVVSAPSAPVVDSPPCSQQSKKYPETTAPPSASAVVSSPKVSVGQDGSAVEWAIPQTNCVKYNQMFVTYDQKKKGYLTGLEARDILSKSGLSVKLLAVIWNLADIDGDGRLTKDEFFVAMYYIDMAKAGKPLPSTLPPDVVPPSCRKPAAAVAAPVEKPVSLPRPTSKPPSDATRVPAIQPPSVAAARRPVTVTAAPPAPAVSSVSKPAAADPFGMDPLSFDSTVPLLDAPLVPVAGVTPNKEIAVKVAISPLKEKSVEAVTSVTVNTEIKTKETAAESRVLSPPITAVVTATENVEEPKSEVNIISPIKVDDKHSAADEAAQLRQMEHDAEERRKALQEQLQREKEEQRKILQEQFEREKEEQTRLFKEQMEKEKEAQRKLLMEMMEKEREEQRRKLAEQKEAAKREMERQRQIEWEQQRKVQLETLKLKEANLVEKLDREISKLKIDLASLDDRKADLGGKTDKGRNVVSDFTSAIEQMRLVRDQKMADINRLQLRIEDSNKRALSAEQDQVQLSMQLQTFKQCHADAFKVMVNSCNTKKAVVDQLKEQLISIDKDTTSRLQLIDSNCSKISELKTIASDVYAQIKMLEDAISEKRAEWNARKCAESAECGKVNETWRQESITTEQGQVTSLEGYRLYTAMYEFAARSDDELSLLPGDLIWIKPENIGAGTGWSVGRTADGREGCFPESYVQPTDDTACGEAILQNNAGISDSVDSAMALPMSDAPSHGGQYQPGTDVVWTEAIYAWNAKKDNHLSFNIGDQIAVYEQQEVWWSGELNGKIGWFPKSYVNVIQSTQKRIEEVQADTSRIGQSSSIDKTSESAELYVAVYAYSSSEDGDLNFNEGDVISVTQSDGDWWSGILGNKSGIFPANFVKKMEAQPPAAVKEEDSPKDSPKVTPVKKPEIGTVIAPYEPTSSDQLALQVGQMIQIRRKTDSGWWEGELQVRGQKRRIGWFPANFVKVLGPGGSRLSAEASGKITSQPPQTVVAASTTGTSVTSIDSPGVSKVIEQAIALFDYQSQQSDELGFVKGNVINILSKEHADWWMGELNGQTGIFPANFVGALS